jgi:uncharacterized protein GlcG (DUF336 family)
MTPEDVLKIVAACKEHLARIEREATIAIVDAGGHLLYLERPEHVSVNSVEISQLKAQTAASRERPSAAFEQRVKERPGFLMMPKTLGVVGGLPLFFEGRCVGGIGVSGIDKDDVKVAQSGVDAFTAFATLSA